MPFPFFTNPNTNKVWDPIYKNLFEIYYHTSDIEKEECKILQESTYKIEKNFIEIDVNDVDGGIPVYKILSKLEKFTLEVKNYNKIGNIIGKFIYKNCEFINKMETMVDFDWSSGDILKPKFEIKYESITYVDSTEIKTYERREKLKRLL